MLIPVDSIICDLIGMQIAIFSYVISVGVRCVYVFQCVCACGKAGGSEWVMANARIEQRTSTLL